MVVFVHTLIRALTLLSFAVFEASLEAHVVVLRVHVRALLLGSAVGLLPLRVRLSVTYFVVRVGSDGVHLVIRRRVLRFVHLQEARLPLQIWTLWRALAHVLFLQRKLGHFVHFVF